MNEFLLKLQDDRKLSFILLGLVAVLALLVTMVAINKYGPGERTVSASAEASERVSQESGEDGSEEPTADEPSGPEIAESQDENLLDQPAAPGQAAGLGIATTTTTVPPTTATPEPTPAPEPTAAEPVPAPEPVVGEEDFVDAGNGVLVPPVMLKIRFCESTDNYTAKNPNSTAAGGYQFLTGSWRAYGHAERYGVSTADQASPAQQDEAAVITWQADGTKPWKASESCWSKR